MLLHTITTTITSNSELWGTPLKILREYGRNPEIPRNKNILNHPKNPLNHPFQNYSLQNYSLQSTM